MNEQVPPPGSTVPPVYAPLSPADERTWGMVAHLSILINLFTGFLGTVAALVIYFVYRDRSRFVAFHAQQAFVFQLIAWVLAGIVAGVLWVLGGVLSLVCVGILLFPLAVLFSLIPIAALVYAVYAGIEVYQGRDFRYWWVGDWVQKNLMH